MRWEGHVVRMGGEERCIQGFGGETEERREDSGVDRRVILKWKFKKSGAESRTGLIWLRIGTGGGLL